jgi:hypothetical protein
MKCFVKYRVGDGKEQKMIVRNCNSIEHAEVKFRAYSVSRYDGQYVCVNSVIEDVGDMYIGGDELNNLKFFFGIE